MRDERKRLESKIKRAHFLFMISLIFIPSVFFIRSADSIWISLIALSCAVMFRKQEQNGKQVLEILDEK